MAKQLIDTGTQGNDGTGDSIRSAFIKTNNNFNELYAIFGQSGTIKLSDLSDGTTYTANQLITANDAGTSLIAKTITPGLGITVVHNTDTIEISSISASLSSDPFPQLGDSLDTAYMPLGRLAYPTQTIVDDFNATWHTRSITTTLDDLPVSVKYYNSPKLTNIIASTNTVNIDFSDTANKVQTFTIILSDADTTINFNNLSAICTTSTYYAFDVVVTNSVALTDVNSVVWKFDTHAVSWDSGIKPQSTTTINSTDIWSFFTYNGGQTLVGYQKLKDIKPV
jgi:hypothetical protein